MTRNLCIVGKIFGDMWDIGYRIEDVLSDENDCNVQIKLKNTHTNKSATIYADKAFDGETLYVMDK